MMGEKLTVYVHMNKPFQNMGKSKWQMPTHIHTSPNFVFISPFLNCAQMYIQQNQKFWKIKKTKQNYFLPSIYFLHEWNSLLIVGTQDLYLPEQDLVLDKLKWFH